MFSTAIKLMFGKGWTLLKSVLSNTVVQYVLIALMACGLLWKGFTLASDYYHDHALAKVKSQNQTLVQINQENEQEVQDLKTSMIIAQDAISQAEDDKVTLENKSQNHASQSEQRITKITNRYAKDSQAIVKIADPVKRAQAQQKLEQKTDEQISTVHINELWNNYCSASAVTGQKPPGC